MALSYSGSTAGSTSANPPALLASVVGGRVPFASSGSTSQIGNLPTMASGGKLWFYSSTNTFTEVFGVASVFGDGHVLGMSNGDVLIGVSGSADTTKGVLYMGVLNCSAGSTSFALSTLGALSATLATGA